MFLSKEWQHSMGKMLPKEGGVGYLLHQMNKKKTAASFYNAGPYDTGYGPSTQRLQRRFGSRPADTILTRTRAGY